LLTQLLLLLLGQHMWVPVVHLLDAAWGEQQQLQKKGLGPGPTLLWERRRQKQCLMLNLVHWG
jgi:hypothetical protein